jgi:hypothetical protein
VAVRAHEICDSQVDVGREARVQLNFAPTRNGSCLAKREVRESECHRLLKLVRAIADEEYDADVRLGDRGIWLVEGLRSADRKQRGPKLTVHHNPVSLRRHTIAREPDCALGTIGGEIRTCWKRQVSIDAFLLDTGGSEWPT